jgi:hypothetical protein
MEGLQVNKFQILETKNDKTAKAGKFARESWREFIVY